MERVYSAVFPAELTEELHSVSPAPASGGDANESASGLTADALEQHDLKTRESFAGTEDGSDTAQEVALLLGESDDDRTTQQQALSDLIDDNSSEGFHSVSDDTEEPLAETTAKPEVYTPPTLVEIKKDLRAALRATVRAFVLAYGAKAFTALLLALRKWRDFKSGSKSALLQLVDPDTVRFGAFMGSLVGTFRFGEIAARLVRGKKDETNLAIAGGLSGLTLLVDSQARRTTISLYIFVRMLDVVGRNLTASGVLPAFKYSTELLFALSNSAILYAYFINPSALTKGYYKWIEGVGALKDAGLEHTIRERLLKGVDAEGAPIPFRACQPHYHPETCVGHAKIEWVRGLGRVAPMYLPVHFLPALLFKLKQIQAAPAAMLTTVSLAALRSCVFLTSYQTIAKLTFCTLRNTFKRDSHLSGWAAGFATGAALFIESPKRRSELMLYCLLRGMEVVWRLLRMKGLVRYVKHSEVALFSLSMALIMSSPSQHFKPTYLRLLRFLFGQNAI